MTKQFTDEEYHNIIELERMYVKSDEEYRREALRNPLTREWAHDQFVEKEKKYRW